MRLAQHVASFTSWWWESLDTIYVARCSPTSALSELIGATSVTGQVPSALRHPWLQMEQSLLTWLILASCSDASVSMIRWCQRRASGLDKPPTTEFQHYLWARELCGCLSTSARMVSRLSRQLTPQASSAAETLQNTGMCITSVCLDGSFYISSPDDMCMRVCLCLSVCVCVQFIVDGRQ